MPLVDKQEEEEEEETQRYCYALKDNATFSEVKYSCSSCRSPSLPNNPSLHHNVNRSCIFK